MPWCGHVPSVEGCRLCWLAEHDPRYRALWNLSAACVHLLPDTTRLVLCDTCRGRVQLKVFGCKLHGECTPHRHVNKIAFCGICKDFSPPTAPGPVSIAS